MTIIEIAAFLGALAWIPQILQWGFNYFTKPQIRVTPEEIEKAFMDYRTGHF